MFRELLAECIIVFQVSLNFDPVKEIPKIVRCHIYIVTKKGIILREILRKMKFFAPPFSTIERD